MLKSPLAETSSATIPLALCLLLRFRMGSARDHTPNPSDVVLIAVSVTVAYKLLTEREVSVQGWDLDFNTNRKVLVEAERHFLQVWSIGVGSAMRSL
jgi:hypothetical protein